MSALKLLLLLLAVLVLAGNSGGGVFMRLAYLLAGLLVIAFVWGALSVRGVAVRRDLHGDRAQVGQEIVERITAINRGRLPRLWLEVRDYSTLPDREPGRVIDLGPRRSQSWTVRTIARRRGEYLIGPTALIGADPFGLFPRRRLFDEVRRVLVYPRTVELAGFALPGVDLPGGEIRPQIGQHASPHVAGVREYVPGDPFGHIHWPLTARQGRLIVREFEHDPTADVWVILDGEREPQRGQGDASTEEYGVVAAASLARHFLERGRAVALAAHAQQPFTIQPDRGTRHLEKFLEALAIFRADGTTPLADVILGESARFGRRTSVVVVTPSLSSGWVEALQVVRFRGVRAVAVLVEPSTFGGRDSSLLQVSSLAAADIPTLLVKRDDDLAAALSSSYWQSLRRG